jgi:hypothetical protein
MTQHAEQEEDDTEPGKEKKISLHMMCRHCGYSDKMEPKTSDEALILMTVFNTANNQKQTVSALNEYTKLDPTLPHLKTIACPNAACSSQSDVSLRDILYIKTDAKNLKYQYSCTVCDTQWGS